MHYTDGLTNDVKQIPEGRIYSYHRGENSLIEVIEAQRTYNQIQEGYYETLFEYTAALLELERVSGKKLLNF